MIDKFIYKCFASLDNAVAWVEGLFAPRCKCGKKNKKDSKRTYKKEKDHATDMTYENEHNGK